MITRLAAASAIAPPDPPSPQAQPRERALLDLLVARGEVLLLPGQPPTQKIAFHHEALADAQEAAQKALDEGWSDIGDGE